MLGKRLKGGLYRAADAGGAGGGGGQAAGATGEPVQATGGESAAAAGQGPEAAADGWTLEQALAEIKNLRGEAAKYRKAKTEAERVAQAAEEGRLAEEKKFAELAEKRAKERDDALMKLQEMERVVWRQKAAQAAGLPAELVERIRGEDEAAMVEDAKALAKLLPSDAETPGAPPGPQKRPAGKSEEELRESALRNKRRKYGAF